MFIIARIGNHSSAEKFLEELRDDETISDLVYCYDGNLRQQEARGSDTGNAVTVSLDPIKFRLRCSANANLVPSSLVG